MASTPPPAAGGRADPPQRVGTFGALREPGYRILWIGGLLSFFAVHMQMIARGWLAFTLTGSNAGLGAVFLGFGVPMLLLSPWGGVAADRLPKRRVLMGAQIGLALSSGAIAVAVLLDVVAFWMLIASSVVQGAAFSFVGPVRMAFTGELVGRARLPNAIVLQQMSMNGTRVIGPSLAGAIIGVAALGIGGAYVATSALFIAALLLSWMLPHGRPAPNPDQGSPFSELVDGLRYVRSRPDVLALMITSFVVIMTAFPYMAFLPTIAERIYGVGAAGFGAMSAVSAVGALAGSFAIARAAGGPRSGRIQVASGIGFGIGVGVLSFAPTYAVALGVILCIGAVSAMFQALNNSLILGATSFRFHGRVQSLLMLAFSGFGLAALPLGLVADRFGLRPTMAVMGGFAALAVGVYGIVRLRLPVSPDPDAEDEERDREQAARAVASADADPAPDGQPPSQAELRFPDTEPESRLPEREEEPS